MLSAPALKATNWNQDCLWSVLCELISELVGFHPGGGSSCSDEVAQVLSQQHSEVGNISNAICLLYVLVLGVDLRFVFTDVGVGRRRDLKLSNEKYSSLAKLLPELFTKLLVRPSLQEVSLGELLPRRGRCRLPAPHLLTSPHLDYAVEDVNGSGGNMRSTLHFGSRQQVTSTPVTSSKTNNSEVVFVQYFVKLRGTSDSASSWLLEVSVFWSARGLGTTVLSSPQGELKTVDRPLG